MKSIEMNKAYEEALTTTVVLGSSAMEETRVLKQLIESAKARIEELEGDAIEEAKICAREQNGTDKGKFLHDNHHYELRKTESFDFDDYRRYPQAAQWRKDKDSRDGHRREASALSKAMDAFAKGFAQMFKDKKPDNTDYTLVCVD